MKIGFMGGTFDPIHLGHLLLAEQARDRMKLDQVQFVPAAEPPHKMKNSISESRHRFEMVKQAICDHPYFVVKDVELRRSGPSYTVDTLNKLTKQYPSDEFFLILGGDMVNYLPNWYKVERIVEMVSIVALARPGFTPSSLPSWIEERVIWLQDAIEIYLSSSMIRGKLARGDSIRYLVPTPVYQYIKENQLYGY